MYETHQKITIRYETFTQDSLLKKKLNSGMFHVSQPDEANQARRIEALDFK